MNYVMDDFISGDNPAMNNEQFLNSLRLLAARSNHVRLTKQQHARFVQLYDQSRDARRINKPLFLPAKDLLRFIEFAAEHDIAKRVAEQLNPKPKFNYSEWINEWMTVYPLINSFQCTTRIRPGDRLATAGIIKPKRP